ncbi:MAG: glycosyltransferase family 4 protein [Beijerinckiaceae bacterium]
MRILHVFRAPLGGLFRHVLDLCQGQMDRGHAVGIFCDSTPANAHSELMLQRLAPDLSLGLHRVAMTRNPHVKDLSVLGALRNVVLAQHPTVVHGHGAKGGLYARLAPKAQNISGPIRVYTPHGGSLNYTPGTVAHAIFMRAERILESRTNLFCFESNYVRDRYVKYVGKPRPLALVVRNGIYAGEFEPLAPQSDASDLVYVGEFRALKGLDILLNALNLVQIKTGRAPSLTMIGSGPDHELLKQIAHQHGVADSVTFLAARPIRQALGHGRIIVVPSRAESLPYVVLEAAGAGVPMIATHVGGIPEVFGPYANRLIPPENVEALSEAIILMMGASEEQRAHAASELVAYMRDHFTVEHMVNGILRGYEQAIAQRDARSR